MLSKSVKVWASFSVVGFHNWPTAPEEVKYLQNVHRHLFKITVALNVSELNREVEFHTLEALSLKLLCSIYKAVDTFVEKEQSLDFEDNSCEMIAEKLVMKLSEHYKSNSIIVEVSEDGEHGSLVELS